MRRSALIFVAGAVVAGALVLTFFDVAPRAKLQPAAQAAPSPSASQSRQAIARPLPDVPVKYSPESQGAAQTENNEPGGAAVPIPTPPEFASIPSDKKYWHHETWRRLHSRLEREPIDPVWSPPAEAALNSAFNESQEITRHGTPTITCRTETCEVQMLAYGAPDVDEGEWHRRFGVVLKPFWSDFNLDDFSVAHESGATAMILHLSKKSGRRAR